MALHGEKLTKSLKELCRSYELKQLSRKKTNLQLSGTRAIKCRRVNINYKNENNPDQNPGNDDRYQDNGANNHGRGGNNHPHGI
jgi:hypothetical protein